MRYSTKMLGLGHGLSVGTAVSMFLVPAEVLLGIRVILKFFFTTNGAGFVHWCFYTTNILLTPFRAIYPNPNYTPGNWYVDWVALFAMFIYVAFCSLLVAWATAGWWTILLGGTTRRGR